MKHSNRPVHHYTHSSPQSMVSSSHKKNKCVWGQNPQTPTKQDRNDTKIPSHHPYILCDFANYVFVICKYQSLETRLRLRSLRA